jgi:hypothetical protein
MQRRTRSGKLYHPLWEDFKFASSNTDPAESAFQIHQTDVSLEELLAAAQDAIEKRSQAFEDAELDSDDESEWEDVDSRPPSPLSPLPESRSPSPETPATTSPVCPDDLRDDADMPPLVDSPLPPATTSPVLPDDLRDDADMPPLVDSPLPPKKSRKARYDKRRLQAKRQKQASSPFTRRVHPKSLLTHRMLPPQTSDFDARNFETTKEGIG